MGQRKLLGQICSCPLAKILPFGRHHRQGDCPSAALLHLICVADANKIQTTPACLFVAPMYGTGNGGGRGQAEQVSARLSKESRSHDQASSANETAFNGVACLLLPRQPCSESEVSDHLSLWDLFPPSQSVWMMGYLIRLTASGVILYILGRSADRAAPCYISAISTVYI